MTGLRWNNRFTVGPSVGRCARQRNRKWCRQGSTLIELVVMMSVTSTLLVIATGGLHKMMDQVSRFRNEQRSQSALRRLSDHFRENVWTASSAEVHQSDEVILTMQDRSLARYAFDQNEVRFTLRSEQNALLQSERFLVGSQLIVAWELHGKTQVKMDAMRQLEPSVSNLDSPPQDQRMVSQVISELSRWSPQPSDGSVKNSVERSADEEPSR